MSRAAILLLIVGVALPGAGHGQRRDVDRQLRQQQERLQQLRRERDSLEAAQLGLRRRARNIESELQNLDQQRTATSRLVTELDRQIAGVTTQLDTITFELILAEDAIAEKQSVLERRVTEIYKRGVLWPFQALLRAESFGDLVSRYKYLFLVSRQDRARVADIRNLRNQIAAQHEDLASLKDQVSVQRTQRDVELREFARLEAQRQRMLQTTQQSQQLATNRLSDLEQTETEVMGLIASLEANRRRAVARGEADVIASMSAADIGRLEWPMEGQVIYRYGREGFRDGTSIQRQGVGIGAPVGTEVSAVRGGIVADATTLGTWGPTVILNNGDGYYTLYLYLSRIDVAPGQAVSTGQPIGLSGGAATPEGPHIEFQIRQTPTGSNEPFTLDPLVWLRPR